MNIHETIIFMHIYMSTHKHIHRHLYKHISADILTFVQQNKTTIFGKCAGNTLEVVC